MTISKTIEGREYTKFVDSPTREKKAAVEVVVGNVSQIASGSILNGVNYDAIEAEYTNSTTETYRYYNGGIQPENLVCTLVVTYTTSDKELISSLVRNDI